MKPSITPESAAKMRMNSLLEKYTEGRDLNERQLTELFQAFPELKPADQISSSTDSDFELENSQKNVLLTRDQEAAYSVKYKKGWRQIRRWVAKGAAAADPCPLHDPEALLRWWPRHFKWRVPPEIEEAAIGQRNNQASEQPNPVEPQPSIAHLPTPQPATTPQVQTFAPVDLENIDPEEGDRLRELKQIQAVKFQQLRDALRGGQDCSLLEAKYLKLCETIDKIETRVTERLKKRGMFISLDEIQRDLAANSELLRQSRQSMVRRVLELCSTLVEEQKKEVADAIERARRTEERIMANLPALTKDDLLRDLAA